MYFRIFRFLHFFTIHISVVDIHVQQSAPLRERERGAGDDPEQNVTEDCAHWGAPCPAHFFNLFAHSFFLVAHLHIACTGGRPALHISSTGTFLLSSCTFAHLQGRLHTLGGVLHLSSTGTFLYPPHICSLHISPTCTSSILHTLHNSP